MVYEVGDEITVKPDRLGKEGDPIANLNGYTVIVQGGTLHEENTLEIVHVNQGVIFTEIAPTAPKRKDIVVDKEEEFEQEFVVINRANMAIKDWELNDGDTIAELNPDYPEKMKCINAVKKEVLDREIEDWEDIPPNEIYPLIKKEGVDWWNFPENRLEKTGSVRRDSNYSQ